MREYHLINDNITLSKIDEKVDQDSSSSLSGKLNALTLYVNLQGTESYKSLRSDYSISFGNNHTLIDMVNEEDGVIYQNKDNHKKAINLVLTQEYLHEIVENKYLLDTIEEFFISSKNVQSISHHKNYPKTQALAYEIFNSPYKNNLEKLHIESKVLDIIYTEFTNLSNAMEVDKKNTLIKFSKQDREAIYYAREILINNLANPPSMKELAKTVAINDLKLKVGFNKFFNETPYGVSLENRLQKAKTLLETSDLNAAEIAKEVGYKYNSNFTKAFIKRFGIRPKDIMKKREYYY